MPHYSLALKLLLLSLLLFSLKERPQELHKDFAIIQLMNERAIIKTWWKKQSTLYIEYVS